MPEAAAGYMWGRGKGSRSLCPNPLLPSSSQNKEKFSKVGTTLLIMNNTYSHQSICLKRNLNGAETSASPSVSDWKPFEARGRLFTDFDVRLMSYFGLWGDRFSQPNFCIGMSAQQGEREISFFWHKISLTTERWAFKMIGLKDLSCNGSTIISLQGKFLGSCMRKEQRRTQKGFTELQCQGFSYQFCWKANNRV